MTSTSPDHLFGLRNSFYVGAYQAAITGSQSVPAHALSPDEVLHRDAILYRSYIAIGSHQLVIDEIGPAAATPLQAVKLLALYLSGGAAGNKVPVGYTPSRIPLMQRNAGSKNPAHVGSLINS
jgi:coatomer protein complex subunit epsilon